MRLRDENKRKMIVQEAARLFSEQPFHKVRLDDVAAAAGIGKGTLYIYFKSKEDLYYSLASLGFTDLLKRLGEQVHQPQASHPDQVREIVAGLVNFAIGSPQLFEVMRTAGIPDASSQWDSKRQEFSNLVEHVIRQGIAAGEFVDPHPEQTALYLPAMVRAVMLYGTKPMMDAQTLTDHVTSVLLKGISKERR